MRLVFFFLPVGSKCASASNLSFGIARCTSRPVCSSSQNASVLAASGKRPECPTIAILDCSIFPALFDEKDLLECSATAPSIGTFRPAACERDEARVGAALVRIGKRRNCAPRGAV